MAHRPDYESADYKEGYEDGKREASKQWQSLSKKEVNEVIVYPYSASRDWVKLIEAKLRVKNNG